MKPKHIEIRRDGSFIELIVDDYELFDFVDDLMAEKGLEYEHMSEEVINGRRFYKMHFGQSVDDALLTETIDSIPPAEIERIWRLNNS